jgi:hypothetical protein
VVSIAVRGKPSGEIEARLAAGDDIEDSTADQATDNLREDTGKDLIGWKAAA